ncbi:MAG: T9SS type A sorting domain-containing protein [Patescibacteria group bacterium]
MRYSPVILIPCLVALSSCGWPPAQTIRNSRAPYGGKTDTASVVADLFFELKQNVPNPFSDSTTIKLELTAADTVLLTIYSAYGSKVATLVDSMLPAGVHRFVWNADNYPSGIYFYQVHAFDRKKTKTMVLLR